MLRINAIKESTLIQRFLFKAQVIFSSLQALYFNYFLFINLTAFASAITAVVYLAYKKFFKSKTLRNINIDIESESDLSTLKHSDILIRVLHLIAISSSRALTQYQENSLVNEIKDSLKILLNKKDSSKKQVIDKKLKSDAINTLNIILHLLARAGLFYTFSCIYNMFKIHCDLDTTVNKENLILSAVQYGLSEPEFIEYLIQLNPKLLHSDVTINKLFKALIPLCDLAVIEIILKHIEPKVEHLTLALTNQQFGAAQLIYKKINQSQVLEHKKLKDELVKTIIRLRQIHSSNSIYYAKLLSLQNLDLKEEENNNFYYLFGCLLGDKLNAAHLYVQDDELIDIYNKAILFINLLASSNTDSQEIINNRILYILKGIATSLDTPEAVNFIFNKYVNKFNVVQLKKHLNSSPCLTASVVNFLFNNFNIIASNEMFTFLVVEQGFSYNPVNKDTGPFTKRAVVKDPMLYSRTNPTAKATVCPPPSPPEYTYRTNMRAPSP